MRPEGTGGAPRVSVVMVVFNGERYVEEAIQSIRAQRFENFEFIIIDDGSTDRTGEILDSFRTQDSRIVVKKQPNSGIAAARNQACALARAPYVACIDADDVATPARLALQVSYLDAYPDIGVLGGGVMLVDESGNDLWIESYPLTHEEIVAAFERFCPFVHSTVMMRRSLLDAVNHYRTLFEQYEDFDLWLRMSERTQLANLSDVLARYRLHSGQSTSQMLPRQALGCLVARTAWRARRAGAVDPTEASSVISAELLADLGIAPADVAREEVTLGLWYAKTIRAAGDDHWRRIWWATLKAARFDRQLMWRVLAYRLGLWRRKLRAGFAAYTRQRSAGRAGGEQ